MQNEYGIVIVKIDNPLKTGEFYGISVYNGLFIKVKGNYYTTVHTLLSDSRFSEYIYNLNKKKGFGEVVEKFKIMHTQYYDNEFFKTVSVVSVEGKNRILSGFYLKTLNLLDNYKQYSDVAKVFNLSLTRKVQPNDYSKNSYSDAISVLNKMVSTYIYGLLGELTSPSGRNYLKTILSPTQIKMIQVAVDVLKKKDTNIIHLNRVKHPLVDALISEQLHHPHPIYSYHTTDYSGSYHIYGINDKITIFYNPKFSGIIIRLDKKFTPKYTTEIVSFKEYYKHYKPKRSKGLVPVFIEGDPVMCYNPDDNSYYFLAQTRTENKYIIVKVPENMISTRNLKSTIIEYNGKTYPIAYTDYTLIITKKMKINRTGNYLHFV